MNALPPTLPDSHRDKVPSPIRWHVVQWTYAVALALAVGLLCWLVATQVQRPASRAFAALLITGIVLAAILYAFRITRHTGMGRLNDLRRRLDQAHLLDGKPDIVTTGWPAFDALGESVMRVLHQRDLHIDQLTDEVEYYRRLAEDTMGLEAYFSPRGRLLWVNPAVERITGYTREECSATADLIDLWVYPKDRNLTKDLARRGLHGEGREDHELRLQRKDGSIVWFSCRWYALRGKDNEIVGVRFSAQDIQQRKDTELKLLETVAALRRAQALKEHYLSRSNDERMRLSSLLDTVVLGILFVDRDRRVVYINQPALDMWQLGSRENIVGARDTVLMDMTLPLRTEEEAYRKHVEEAIAMRDRSSPYDVYLTDGRVIRQVSAIVPSSDGKHGIGRVWVYEDVTEAHRSERRLTELAERDPLTGLYNRRRFLEELERQIADGQRRHEQVGLISFDLDGFKAINDTFGHQAGDEVLMALSNEVGSIVRRNELFFRLGGDEFAILVSSTDEERVTQLARRILITIGDFDFRFDGQDARVTVSLGIAMAPIHATDPSALVAAADRAMYLAKSRGKNRQEIAETTQTDLFNIP
ncbi:MAG TPA: diguanylate cyclase [Rhodocyclaceae bacterium]|nr:diguanylate cyclase [Rhodocyclaceae bacterium]